MVICVYDTLNCVFSKVISCLSTVFTSVSCELQQSYTTSTTFVLIKDYIVLFKQELCNNSAISGTIVAFSFMSGELWVIIGLSVVLFLKLCFSYE